MTAHQDLSHLMADPSLYPFQVNWLGQQIYLLQAKPSFYGDAAFLDQRAIQPGMQGNWANFQQVRQLAHGEKAHSVGLIFHVGHCGSTLLSRALGLIDGLFCLREPLPLREMATFWVDRKTAWAQRDEETVLEDMDVMRALWARTPTPNTTSVIKATSFCSLLAKPWLARFPSDRAIFLSMAPETYITTLLGSDSYVTDLMGGAKPRMKSLIEATGASLAPLHTLSAGEIAAMTYTAEMISMQHAAEVGADRIMRVDFDRYLKRPGETLKNIVAHLGRSVDDQTISDVLANPILGRYSKATDYAFSAGERQERLRASKAANHDEIAKGMAWLISFARDNSMSADALRAFGYAN